LKLEADTESRHVREGAVALVVENLSHARQFSASWQRWPAHPGQIPALDRRTGERLDTARKTT
jgi:hypothetical protein